ncbi:MAG: hypothetical protein K9J30_10600 [Bacteroidales bacterium]|nr:hypothetical protein [Bacteroidales bacterium]
MARTNLKETNTTSLKKIRRNNYPLIVVGILGAIYLFIRYFQGNGAEHYLVGGIVFASVGIIVLYRTILVSWEIKGREDK